MRIYYFFIADSVSETSGSTCPAKQRHILEELNFCVQLFKLMKIRKTIPSDPYSNQSILQISLPFS
jgi:hypothetical protein